MVQSEKRTVRARTIRVSLQLVVISMVAGFLIYSLGVGFAFYLVPLNIVLSVYILLKEVSLMIDSSDVAVES